MKFKDTDTQKNKEKFERTMTALFNIEKSVLTEKIKKKAKKGKA